MNVNIEKQRQRGVAVLLSWLRASGLEAAPDGEERIVTNKGAVFLSKYDLGALSKNDLAEFHKVTQDLGVGQPNPVRAPPSAEQRVRDFDMTVFRHVEYRAAPDLTAEQRKKYRPVMVLFCRNFAYKNHKLLKIFGLEQEDLLSYAEVWTANFVHKYQLQKNDAENKKLLGAHLKQRFSGLRKMILRKIGETSMWCPMDFHLEYEHEHNREPTPAPKKKKMPRLEDMGLEHDKFVQLLKDAASNLYIHIDARKCAKRKLEEHSKTCAVCQKNEQAEGMNPLC